MQEKSKTYASLVTAYAALRPRDGFSHPHQEHMKDTYNLYYLIDGKFLFQDSIDIPGSMFWEPLNDIIWILCVDELLSHECHLQLKG